MTRRAVLAIAAITAIAAVTVAASQTAAQAPAGPSIQITQGALSQVGDDLRLRLRLSRALPVDQLQVAAGRVVCVALDPRAASRRSVCVSRSRGHLRATIGAIDASGSRTRGGLRLSKVFTPTGAFRQTMVFRGRRANVRQSDGIHFSTAGASIAASLIIERLRADHLLPRLR